jgi:hypothetical protein
MAATPLYKFLKTNGTNFYAFPGASEDISAAYQNENYKMYFSKYALINLPKQQLNNIGGTQASQIYWDFSVFQKSVNATPPASYQDQVIESLRNYVANQEIVIRESRLNNTQYYYDTKALETVSEKVFFKWAKELNLVDFEPAIPEDEYFSNLDEFKSQNINDDSYFPEYLWKEREVIQWETKLYYQSSHPSYSTNLEIEFGGTTNFRIGDIVKIYNVSNSSIYSDINGIGPKLNNPDGIKTTVLFIIPGGATQGQRIVFDVQTTLSLSMETTGVAELVYHRLVQYVGEVNGISNVQEANRSYTEVYAHIPDHTGRTPDILFRTLSDTNYKPNMTFPIIPSQYQPEIMGAELFNSPIVSTPQNYPGGYFGHFDTLDFTYETSTGDTIRRSGDYYGVNGDINSPVVNGSTIDGISLDFNTDHYVKMNIENRVLTNFDQFNALEVNNLPPVDFEFNAILWYYTVRDEVNGIVKTNLYGISFLDNPNNDIKESDFDLNGNGLKFPTYKKLVTNGYQDGTSYAFSLNLNFNIINENPQDSYNPEAINSLFSMNLFNEAMRRLASANDSFLNVLAENIKLKDELTNLKQLIYTQTDLSTINSKINYLEGLLKLYSTNQMTSSDSISVSVNNQTSPPQIFFENIDPTYFKIDQIETSDMYNAQGIIPININVPENKNFLIYINNNDEVNLSLQNNDRLTLVLDKDLYWKQSVDILITSNDLASQNKKLDIYIVAQPGVMNSSSSTITQIVLPQDTPPDFGSSNGVETLLIGDIDLPVFYNPITQLVNSAKSWKDFKFVIDFNQSITLMTGGILQVPLLGNTSIISNSIKSGDTLVLNNLFVGTSSTFNFSGQYSVDSIGGTGSSYIMLDVNSNSDLIAYGSSASLPLLIHGSSSTLLSNLPYISLNKGKKIKITRIEQSSSPLNERYHIDIEDIK